MINLITSCKRSKESANKLEKALSVPVIVLNKGELPSQGNRIFNYGCSWLTGDNVIVNDGKFINLCRNKLAFFSIIHDDLGYKTVPYTTENNVAQYWNDNGYEVFGRDLKMGCNGDGLIHYPEYSLIKEHKLYTKRVIGDEYRIYMFRNKVLSVYRKHPLTPFPIKKWKFEYVKSHNLYDYPTIYSGFPIDFIALDVIYSGEDIFILEGNTAPILFPITIKRLIKELNKEVA